MNINTNKYKTITLKSLNIKYFKGVNVKKIINGNCHLIPSGAVFPEKIKKEKCYTIDFNYLNNKDKEKILINKDILFNTGGVGTLGRVAFFNKEQFTNKCYSDAFVLVLRNEDRKLISKFLFYWLRTLIIQKYIKKFTVGSTGITSIKSSDIMNLPIPLIPIEIQEKIVSIIENVEYLKQKREETNEETNKIIKIIFYEMFGGLSQSEEYAKLNEICKFIDYRGKTPTKIARGIKLITAKNVKKGYVQDEPSEYISEKEYGDWMRRGFPKEGDILFTTEAPLGNVARLGKFTKIALAQRIIDLQPISKSINSYYLMYYLLSNEGQKKIISYATGSTVSGVRAKELKLIDVPIPPIETQNQFAAIVEKIESLKEKQLESTSDINRLFDALMQKAFTGELNG